MSMKKNQLVLFCCWQLLLFSLEVSKASFSTSQHKVMTWLCLEFCNETNYQIQSDLQQIERHKNTVTAVSFEKYTLGPNSSLVTHNLTNVISQIQAMGLETWPMLSSFPHPPEFIQWMRDVFANPQDFFAQCIQEAKQHGYTGYSLDWEPTAGIVPGDGIAYAHFINAFANSLNTVGVKLSVDVATWSPVWNYSAIADTNAESIVSMGTYTSNDISFTHQLDLLVGAFGQRASMGLETVNASTGQPIPLAEVQWRLQQAKMRGVTNIALWRSPIPDSWFPLLRKFVIGTGM